MNDGAHDVPHDEADPFEALLKRAEELKNGDDVGLEALAKAAIEAKLSLPRIDKLQRAAIKPTGFALIVIRRVFDEARSKVDRERTAQKQADPSVAAAEEAARLAAIEAEKAAREAERERLRQACRDLAEDPELMERLEAVVRRLGVVGEAANISGAYLVATSRLLEKNALSLLRRGAAAGGKNFLLANVVTLLPESEVIQLSGVSATALVYFGEDEDALQHKLVVVVEAAILAERSNGDENPALVLLRSLLSEGSIDRMVTVPQRDGPPKAIRVRRKGPVAVMMTSARDNVESEMLTRLLVCDADESPEQSERVLTRKLNQGEQLAVVAEEEIERWRDLQRWLTLERPYRVAIPFEKAIHEAYIDLVRRHPEILQQLRIRRDISGLIGGIQASATLHKAQRQTDPEGRIVAAIDDYANAWAAFNTGVSSIYGTRVRKEIIALVKVAEDMGAELYDEGQSHGVGSDNPSVEITLAAMRQALGVGSNKTASRRLQEALELGLLKQDHDRPNRGRATARAFWLLKTSIALRATDGPNVFPLPEDVKKIFEEGGRVDVPVHGVLGVHAQGEKPAKDSAGLAGNGVHGVHGVHGVRAQAEEVAIVDTVDTVATDNPDPPHQENFFNSWSEVDGVTVVYCVTYGGAEALIREIIADAAGKPIALDIETRQLASELERLKALEEERAAVNAEAIAFRRDAKKAGAPQAEVDAHTGTADARLKALDARIDHAASAGLDPNRSEIRLLQVYGGGARAAVVDIAKAGTETLGLLEGVSAVIHNAPFDLAFLQHRGVTLGKAHDSMQAAILTLGKNKCSLAAAVKHYCKTDLNKAEQSGDWSTPDLSEDQIRYAARDVIWLWRLCPPLFADLGPQISAYKIQAAAAPAIARLNSAGIAFNAGRHADTLRALAEAEEIVRADFRAACLAIGKPELALTIPETPQEISAVLKAVLTEAELANWTRIKSKWELSTARAELQKALHHLPIVHLVELSELVAPRRSFGETLRVLVSPGTGRVYPRYQIAGAQTGRSSTSKPNIQGASRDPRIREAFKAADGYVLVAADYSCMELRAAGCFFDDPQLSAVFERGDDPHRLTASHVAGRPLDTITDGERSKAKNVNFGTIYGIGPSGLVAQIWKNYRLIISLADAETLLAGFASLYPTLIEHRRNYAAFCQARRAIIIGPDWREGRGRIIPLARLPDDQSPLTCAYAYPIQGICADICMKALTEVDRQLLAEKIDGRLVGWIHDELLVETREADVDRVKALLQQEMERAFIDIFPAATRNKLIEVKVTANWAEAKERAKVAAIEEPSCAP